MCYHYNIWYCILQRFQINFTKISSAKLWYLRKEEKRNYFSQHFSVLAVCR